MSDAAAPTRKKSRRPRGSGAKSAVGRPSGGAEVERWFASRGWTPWEFQREAWEAYRAGRSGLVQVATGAGKTFAAYMGPLAEMIDEAGAGALEGLRVLYVTPLRAVSRDIELALKEPVKALRIPARVESRTGDTGSSVRARQKQALPQVLVTTPESLTLMLTWEDAPARFAGLRAVIVDEWHELLSTKRGTQTELALARLRRFSPRMRAWALSATLPNAEEAARAVAGVSGPEPVVVRGVMERPVVIDSVLPADPSKLPMAGHLGLAMLGDVANALDPATPTLVFTNTRSQAERWFHAILVMKPEWAPLMALHHGSIDRAERERIEKGLKSGAVRIAVATSSLDLGVDFSPIERVFQIGSPKGIARLVQRAGRSGHRPMQTARITCVPTHALELVEIAASRECLAGGEIERRDPPCKPLDALAQHMVTCAIGGGFVEQELFDEVRTAWSFRDLTRQEFDWALALVREGGGTLAAYPEFRRVALVDGAVSVTSDRIRRVHRLNVGTITSDSTVEVRYHRGRALGRVEENFISGLRAGQRFVFAGKTLEFVEVRDMAAIVRPARGSTSYTPIWGGTRLPISESLAEAIRRTLELASDGRARGPELSAAAGFLAVQQRCSCIPRADETLVELCESREGSHMFLLTFEGRLVNGGLGALLALRLSRCAPATFAVAANDYGLEVLSARPFDFASRLTAGLFGTHGLAEDAAASVNLSELARLQFREVARVAGLVFQSHPGSPKSSRQLSAGAGLIYDVLTEFDPHNLLLHQARREVMERHFEQSRLARTLERIASSRMRVMRPARFTPLSFPLVIERQSAHLTSESIQDRIRAMAAQWEGA